jgi:hypothetical protein
MQGACAKALKKKQIKFEDFGTARRPMLRLPFYQPITANLPFTLLLPLNRNYLFMATGSQISALESPNAPKSRFDRFLKRFRAAHPNNA